MREGALKMSTFITNTSEKSLKKRLKTLINQSEELKFLVGFFYFSALKELYETLKKLDEEGKLREGHIKILVGLNVDKGNYGIYETAKKLKFFNQNRLKNEFFNSLKTAFTSNELDQKEVYSQVEFFLKLLQEKKLIIKKNREPNHAKLYLFKLDRSIKEILRNLFITGSSNLTRAGLESQEEFNVEVKDYGFSEAERYFDNLWNKAIPLTEDDVQKIIEIFQRETFLREITPFVAYAYLLKVYLELHTGKTLQKELIQLLTEKGYKPFDYQLSAVSQALANCEAHGGTILADVVGLGKTIIACLVAKALGKRGIVICPPHLVGDKDSGWIKYLEDFKLWEWRVFSLGKLEYALGFVKDKQEIEVVIVDEAHRFRNERTEQYHYLREICRGRKVILLSATPFNNRPSDLFALLKLFTIPKRSTIVLDEDLESRFQNYEIEFRKLAYIRNYWNSTDDKRRKRAKKYYIELFGEKVKTLTSSHIEKVKQRAKLLAKEIRALLEPVVIRRNRLDLKFYKDKEKIELPEVKDPSEWFFELTPKQLNFYDEVITAFAPLEHKGRFNGAIYFPIRYEKGLPPIWEEIKDRLSEEENFLYVYQRNLYDIMRRLLVKRFESSFGAFYESLRNFKNIHQTALEFIERTDKFILDRKLMEKLIDADEDTILEELEKYQKTLEKKKENKKFYKIYELKKFKNKKQFIEDIKADIALFDEFLQKMETLGLTKNDPKAKRLIKGLKEFLKEKRKVVIFTEYKDTARHLENILKDEFKDKVFSAIGNFSRNTAFEVYKNFDAQYFEQEDSYDILLTTDKLSEGFNLNRAGAVINYDIPWNPVRVIQRIGRINRIGKKVYNEIYIVNFFPTEIGADFVKSREIAQTKMFMIHNVLGEDAKIFDAGEEPQASELYKRLTSFVEREEESFFTRVRREFDKIIKNHPNIKEELKSIPKRIKVAKRGSANELMVFVKKGKDLFVGYQNYLEKQPKAVSFEEVFEKIKAKENEEKLPLSENFWKYYHFILEKSSFEKRRRESPRSLQEQAYGVLRNLTDFSSKPPEFTHALKPYFKFLSDIMEDIRDFRTLSEYVMEKIISWKDYLNSPQELLSNIKKLKDEIGEDFLERMQKQLKDLDKEIIIAIENQIN